MEVEIQNEQLIFERNSTRVDQRSFHGLCFQMHLYQRGRIYYVLM
jgi:hypothetical protein